MASYKLPKLRMGDLEVEVPIIQGGMGVGISLSGLASAVANAGGIGLIAAAGIGMFEPDQFTHFKEANKRAMGKEIRKAKSLTDGIIGVNIMMAHSDFDELVQCAVDEGADVVVMGAGLPTKLPSSLPLDNMDSVKTKFIPIVSSARAAKIIFKSWAKLYNHIPDAVVLEGPMAGGHLGFKKEQISDPDYALEKLLPEVVAEVKVFEDKFDKKVPVIAAGGVFTGADIKKVMDLGASGVQMGTRFVATHESDASPEFKQAYLDSKKDDLIIIDSPVGLPGRALNGTFLKRIMSGVKEKFTCPWKCLRTCDFKHVPYCIALSLTSAKKGDLDNGYAFAGANAYRIDKLVSVQELIDELDAGYAEACSS